MERNSKEKTAGYIGAFYSYSNRYRKLDNKKYGVYEVMRNKNCYDFINRNDPKLIENILNLNLKSQIGRAHV